MQLTDRIRTLASEFGDVDAVSLDSVELQDAIAVERDDGVFVVTPCCAMDVKATVRMKPDPSQIVVSFAKVV
jgi:hypothetical protein